MLFHCDDSDFEQKVLNKEGTILVDFYADWCGPCQMLAPTLEELSEDHEICKVNVDNAMQTARKYNVQSIPTLIVFKNGELRKFSIGYIEKEEILAMLEA